MALPSLVTGWYPPSRENWEFIAYAWQFFPLVTALQWLTDWYPAGKTSVESKYNLPGKWAWAVMESVGPITVMYCMLTIPSKVGVDTLPWGNWTMAFLYVVHYIYRAPIFAYVSPSMSPIHPLVFASACLWNLINGLSIGGWVGGYGPNTREAWAGRLYQMEIGLVIWGWSFLANFFHDDDLREIRRSTLRRQKEQAKKEGKPIEGIDKFYMVPKNGLFQYVLFAHYLCEFFEWAGFWMVGGLDCLPARTFLINEMATMIPRAVAGKRWYIEKFGKEKIGKRKAIFPGLL
ncbi:hypothetical protein LTR95_018432 [Oleoguttula sp. CCFEE 5521]